MYTASPLPQDAVHEAAASLESRLRHAVLLTSEVDVRVILNARTALMTELEGREEVWPGPLVPDACVCHLHGTLLNDKAGSRVRTIPPSLAFSPHFFSCLRNYQRTGTPPGFGFLGGLSAFRKVFATDLVARSAHQV